jgi:FkbM family methyltransferase
MENLIQKFYENLFKISLIGMNIGTGGDISSDGELNVMHYVKNQCSSSKEITIFDVGANVGNYSQKIVKEFKNLNFQLYSFEPSKETFFELKKCLGNLPNIKLHNIGFGEKSGVKTLFYDKKKSGLASMYNRRLLHFGIKMNLRELIKIYTIDDFCKRNRIRKIDFLKLDTEGYELNILNGAKNMIEDDAIKFIQFEFGGCNIDSRTYFQDFFYLLKEKYYIYRILKNGFYRIDSYKETYELFLTTNFLAELKKNYEKQ